MIRVAEGGGCAVYQPGDSSSVLVATTPESREVCNHPLVYGVEYTGKLRTACCRVLRALSLPLVETETSVVHLLRGGLNFGLREALAEAYGWNRHGASFLSAQRKRKSSSPEDWEICESEYRKFVVPSTASLILGDVVASGASLRHGLDTMLDAVRRHGSRLRSIVFFTIGGPRTEEVFGGLEERLRTEHPEYEGSTVIYLEGRFPVAWRDTPLSVKITGTDLLRQGRALAPEFVESQYDSPMFPVERCTIYDAGSRAFEPRSYLIDVLEYWETVATFHGRSFTDYVRERCPVLDVARFDERDLVEVAERQVARLREHLSSWPDS